MSDLREQCETVAETIAAYVEQIRDGVDVPTVDDTPIDEYPLEVVNERGKEFAVVISTGGPHIEVAANGGTVARLEGYLWGDRATIHGDQFDTFLSYFIDREDGD